MRKLLKTIFFNRVTCNPVNLKGRILCIRAQKHANKFSGCFSSENSLQFLVYKLCGTFNRGWSYIEVLPSIFTSMFLGIFPRINVSQLYNLGLMFI